MITEALKYLQSLAKPTIHKVGELEYANQNLNLLKPPEISVVTIHNLSGMVDLVTQRFERLAHKSIFLIVESPTKVYLCDRESNPHAQRKFYAVANCAEDLPRIPFGGYMDSETFIIMVASMFCPGTGDYEKVMAIASNLSSESVHQADDTGLAQRVTIKRGVTLTGQTINSGRVKLAPYRTFRDAEQPVGEFILRFKSQPEEPPLCALFDADGGKWKLDAIQNVATYLSKNTPDDVVVIA